MSLVEFDPSANFAETSFMEDLEKFEASRQDLFSSIEGLVHHYQGISPGNYMELDKTYKAAYAAADRSLQEVVWTILCDPDTTTQDKASYLAAILHGTEEARREFFTSLVPAAKLSNKFFKVDRMTQDYVTLLQSHLSPTLATRHIIANVYRDGMRADIGAVFKVFRAEDEES